MPALLIDLGWKSALIAGLALLASHALRGRAAAERVLVLRAAVTALLALPLLALAIPTLEIGILPARDVAPVAALAVSQTGAVATHAAAGYPPVDGLAVLYWAGVTFVLLRLLAGLLTLRRWTRTAIPASDARWLAAAARASAKLRRPVRLLVSPHVAAPMSWGVVPAWLLIGPATERHAEQAEAVIAHEMAHVRRFDWPMLVASQLATALFWFNPLAWLVDRELVHQTELAADDEAVRHVTQTDYARTLLTVANAAANPVACGMAIPKTMLARRIRRVLDGGHRPPASRLLCAALLVCGAGMTAPLAAMKLVRVSAPPIDNVPSAPQAQGYLPAIIPVARAEEPPEARRPQDKPAREAATATARVAAPARAPTPLAERGSPPLPAASSQAGPESADAAVERRRAERQGRAIIVNGRRELAKGLSDSANDMRDDARKLEDAAAREGLSQKDREAQLRTARSLRIQAEQLDAEARRLIFGT